jgi:subtilase family protein
MKSKVFCILMGAALGVLGVSSAAQRPSVAADIREDKIIDWIVKSRPAEADSAYTKTRWIGLQTKGKAECPPVPGWQAEPLLDPNLYSAGPIQESHEAAAVYARLRELALDRFCVYTKVGVEDFDRPPGLVAAEDRMALSASASLERKVSPELAATFLAQAGHASLSITGEPTVRLTFIDSLPDGELPTQAPAGSQHGYTLAQLARQLVCPTPSRCAAVIASRRALSYDDFKPRQPLVAVASDRSGHVGLVSDLAVAIVTEVLKWRQAGTPKHLILNLSLGWDGELFGDLKKKKASDLEPSARAVYSAIRFARRSGALVIASAGNVRGGPTKSAWPLLPAAWELRRPCFWPFPLGRKAVYAVGGVDWQGLPLPNSRRGGHPRRVAFGDHAVAQVASPGADIEPTTIYTGTSVSAAVVSSTAAVVWHLRPDLRPGQVARLISRSGKKLAAKADFYAWRKPWPLSHLLPRPRMRQVSLCTAVARIRGQSSEQCLKPRPPELWPLFPGDSGVRIGRVTLPLAGCDPKTRLLTLPGGSMPDAPCPTEQFASTASQRWLMPQPGDDPCPGCTLVPKPPPGASSSQLYELELEISREWRESHPTYTLDEHATLDIDRYENGELQTRLTYPFTFDPESGAPQPVVDLGDGEQLFGCIAQINFTAKNEAGEQLSIQNPVIVDP